MLNLSFTVTAKSTFAWSVLIDASKASSFFISKYCFVGGGVLPFLLQYVCSYFRNPTFCIFTFTQTSLGTLTFKVPVPKFCPSTTICASGSEALTNTFPPPPNPPPPNPPPPNPPPPNTFCPLQKDNKKSASKVVNVFFILYCLFYITIISRANFFAITCLLNELKNHLLYFDIFLILCPTL